MKIGNVRPRYMSHIETLHNNKISAHIANIYNYSLSYVLALLGKVEERQATLEGEFIEEINRLRYRDMYI